jgi:hypothetical protein
MKRTYLPRYTRTAAALTHEMRAAVTLGTPNAVRNGKLQTCALRIHRGLLQKLKVARLLKKPPGPASQSLS